MESEYSDQEHEQIMDRVKEWYYEFEKSNFFLTLSSRHQESAGFIIHCFSEYMYSYQGAAPDKWNVGDMKEVCTEILPRKVTADNDTFEAMAPVLESFFLFLFQANRIPSAKKLAEKVISLSNIIVRNAANPSNWGMAKSMAMMAESEGVDFTDIGEMNKLLDQKYKNGENNFAQSAVDRILTNLKSKVGINSEQRMIPIINPNKIGVNSKCPCGSGKKYKKCCIGKRNIPNTKFINENATENQEGR